MEKNLFPTSPEKIIPMTHSDCDGELSVEACADLAETLERRMPLFEEYERDTRVGGDAFVGITKEFINGCRRAVAAGEPIKFS